MFKNSSIMVISADSAENIYRLEVDSKTQEKLCTIFNNKAKALIQNKEIISFDGHYKPDGDEILCIDNFKLPEKIKKSIEDPFSVRAYPKKDGSFIKIKAIFLGDYISECDEKLFHVAIQKFHNAQYLDTSRVNLFWTYDTFHMEEREGIIIESKIDSYYDEGKLYFPSFFIARQIFDLHHYYRSATNEEVNNFIQLPILRISNPDGFMQKADEQVRKKIAAIQDSEILSGYTGSGIKRLAEEAGIFIDIQNGKIIIPDDKKEIKKILSFLNEEAYKGPFSQDTFIANSKRKIKNHI